MRSIDVDPNRILPPLCSAICIQEQLVTRLGRGHLPYYICIYNTHSVYIVHVLGS